MSVTAFCFGVLAVTNTVGSASEFRLARHTESFWPARLNGGSFLLVTGDLVPLGALPQNSLRHSAAFLVGVGEPAMNSRIVRPREMRARKRPTNGSQAIHQSQNNIVQALRQSTGRSSAWGSVDKRRKPEK